jgi:indolepyruvate ferredoxin oxidoreductase
VGGAGEVSLEDKYRLDRERALISGRQALVRLPILQRALDQRRGLNTAGLISGYRGSPLGSYDLELWKAQKELLAHNIHFQPGLNEDLALTALAGAQQIDFLPGRTVEGVFCIWYGKGPGVDRSGDAIKHANLHGVGGRGGILMVFGDDHSAKSSTTAHQSDLTLASYEVPVLYPSSVAEVLELGLAGFALSRYAGLLVGLKLVNETADATAVVDLTLPADYLVPDQPNPDGGVGIRPEVLAAQRQDVRLFRYKLPRARAFARANRLDKVVFGAATPRLLIATAGKAFTDVMSALGLLGIDAATARLLGVGVYKVALVFPLEPEALQAAAAQATEILFVEEKRPHMETQARVLLYNCERRPTVSGKQTPQGEPLLPADMPLDARVVASALVQRLRAHFPGIDAQLPGLADISSRIVPAASDGVVEGPLITRRPAFCPGCPHNTSTRVPQGSFGATGIGCHSMVLFQRERNPIPMGHMGGEGAHWIGLSGFTGTRHIFQNLGDGTYNHSGSLAIRAAVQAQVNITYKILLNDAVAMTGGQPVEGALTVSRVVRQVHAEGVSRVVVVAEDPGRFAAGGEPLPEGTELRHRDELAGVQNELRQHPGVTVLIYDQVCAAEKRRRRKLGAYPDPSRRLFINAAVCEGCGDCSIESNCLAVQPLETELGRKRVIDQSSCNKDFSCVKGFCPSFVTVTDARPRRTVKGDTTAGPPLPEATFVPTGSTDILIAGVGGTGVVTLSAIVGMAARLDGLYANLYDMTGLSQKAGQVFSHIRIRPAADVVVTARIGAQEADVLLACDLIAAASSEAIGTVVPGRTRVIVNSDTPATADFQTQGDQQIPESSLLARLSRAAAGAPACIPASTLSQELLGDSIGANILLLGYAWQLGAIALSRTSIEQAIRLNGRGVAANLAAFEAGRRATLLAAPAPQPPVSLDTFIARRVRDLTEYQNAKYAQRYGDLLRRVQLAAASVSGSELFAWAVAKAAYKVMAYKDEYEVARLYGSPNFRDALAREFEGYRSLQVHLSPPLLARKDPVTGRPGKLAFGSWIFPVFKVLAALRFLREGPFDVFGTTGERKREVALREAYLAVVEKLAAQLSESNLRGAVDLAAGPLAVRGYGPVKAQAAQRLLEQLQAFRSPGAGRHTG